MRLRGGPWEMEIQPERGGRVRSLRLEGVELLDQGIGVDDQGAVGFVEAGAFGWDEMVPTVDTTHSLPDHGEAWRLPWTVDDSAAGACSMSCEGRVLPWRLERRLELGPVVRADYRMTNIGGAELPAYWCSHALFRYTPGVSVDAGASLMRIAEGRSGKFFVPRGSIDRARIGWEGGVAIELAWNAARTPYCGVWICNGDLGGYRQVAVEPATGGGDRPDSDEPPPMLEPGASLDWWLEIRPL